MKVKIITKQNKANVEVCADECTFYWSDEIGAGCRICTAKHGSKRWELVPGSECPGIGTYELKEEDPLAVSPGCGEILPYEITAQFIVKQFLQQHGCDGLYHEAIECGCHIGDLMLCERSPHRCRPGYLCQADGLIYPQKRENPPNVTI